MSINHGQSSWAVVETSLVQMVQNICLISNFHKLIILQPHYRDTLCHIDNYYIYNSSLYGVGGRAQPRVSIPNHAFLSPTTRFYPQQRVSSLERRVSVPP
jgi:hypothetical protein